MIQFSKLSLNGFKSFVDRTEIDIAPGLNGIVGPNGCGKSNLVEALRWVMGESSAKRMRGGGMEDVIFSGTDKRSPRNIAEVSLLLDNAARTAPAAYNNSDEIEITRRIERDHGSNYKINGRNMRARDVQMLFADTVTGANSPAMVSQGRVAQIINSKPLDRRLILEESAGISGLYARRHEAELRLKAADGNLVRIEDILGGMESRLNDLKRQSRQATRYRNVSAQIRQLEILIAYIEWQNLEERMNVTREKFNQSESAAAKKLSAVTELTKTQNEQAEKMAPLRQKEAEIAAGLQTQKLTLHRLEDEAARLEQTQQETEEQLKQAHIDESHEKQSLKESTEVLERLEQEQEKLKEKQDSEDRNLNKKQKAKEELEKKVLVLEEKYTALMQGAAEAKARKQSLEQQIEQNTQRLETVRDRKTKAEEDLKQNSSDKNKNKIDALESEIKELEEKLNKLNEDITSEDNALQKARGNVDEARELLRSAETKKSEFIAQTTLLKNFLDNEKEEDFGAVLESITAESGFEKALSRALGDTLLASLDDKAPAKWVERKISDMPDLPKGVEALLSHIKAPKALHLALSQIGLVTDDKEGKQLLEKLLPGQALVSRDGAYWRWDGFYMTVQASDRNALRLEQKNKLRTLEKKRPQMESLVQKAQEALKTTQEKQAQIEKKQAQFSKQKRNAEEDLVRRREELSELRQQQVHHDSEILRLKDVIKISDEDIKTLEEVIKWDNDRLQAYKKESVAQESQDTEKIRSTLAEAREAHQAAVSAFDMHQQEQNSRKARLHAISDERINLQNRAIRSRERLKQLEERKKTLSEKLEELKNQPQDFKDDKEKLLSSISELEEQRNIAAEKLAACENELTEIAKTLKQAENELSEMREARAHAQATLAAMQEQNNSITASIQEQFDMKPEELLKHAAIEIDEKTGDLETLRGKKEKFLRERDNVGPVNLRADEEAQDLEKEVAALIRERNDLMQAIEELRSGIQKINKEARERLVAAFEHVNAHFQNLFTRLFAGGQAHLALVDSDDPLGAGLEIFAQPPGKKLQSLSLLSGGEQALASIALIFAMFLTNPSPICVLDEIDAPLDDANVDRVCDLLEEIAERGETRFVIITHHRMTMARMDRLYGVTMAEKGISQLVSVDLQQSFEFLEEAA